MGKDLNVSRLCDAYGSLLTEHRRALIRSYYDDDLSLSEIAENYGITRQAALCAIKQAVAALEDYESKLLLVQKRDELINKLTELKTSLDSDVLPLIDAIINEI